MDKTAIIFSNSAFFRMRKSVRMRKKQNEKQNENEEWIAALALLV